MLGTVHNKYTFRQLLESGYIPFTFKVFTGEEKVQPGKVWIGNQVDVPENGTSALRSCDPENLWQADLHQLYSVLH